MLKYFLYGRQNAYNETWSWVKSLLTSLHLEDTDGGACPFSLKIAQDIFQNKMDQTFEGCKAVVGIADEILVFGKIHEEHDRNMQAMLKRFLGTALELNPIIAL